MRLRRKRILDSCTHWKSRSARADNQVDRRFAERSETTDVKFYFLEWNTNSYSKLSKSHAYLILYLRHVSDYIIFRASLFVTYLTGVVLSLSVDRAQKINQHVLTEKTKISCLSTCEFRVYFVSLQNTLQPRGNPRMIHQTFLSEFLLFSFSP